MKFADDEETMFEEGWEEVRGIELEVAPAREKSTVFSMKIDAELLRMLVDQAREMNMPTSTLAREMIREGLLKRSDKVPTYKLAEILCRRIEEQESSIYELKNLVSKNLYSQPYKFFVTRSVAFSGNAAVYDPIINFDSTKGELRDISNNLL